METVCWILLGLAVADIALYFVFTFAKKVELVQKITSSLLFPILGSLYICLLFNYTPDSIHIIKLSIISILFLSISITIEYFVNEKLAKIITPISFLISLIPLADLSGSIFLIHRVPAWINIIAACAYAVIFFLFFIIFIKKASLLFYGFGIVSLIIAAFLNYCSLLTLCYTHAAFSIVRFLGTIALIGYLVFQLLNNSVINLKLKKLISLMILLASFILICLSNLIILY